jgi:hypothetical protein
MRDVGDVPELSDAPNLGFVGDSSAREDSHRSGARETQRRRMCAVDVAIASL